MKTKTKMKALKKSYKKYFVLGIFLLPLIICLVTSISIKSFVDYHFSTVTQYSKSLAGYTEDMFIFIVIMLFLNAIFSFASLITYFCLVNRVNNILGKRGEDEK